MALSQELRAHFASIGPAGLKQEIAEGRHGIAPDSPKWREAELWIESELIRRAEELESRRDAREERMLSITFSALEIAKASASASERAALAAERQTRWAIWAAIIATTAAIVAASVNINELIAWLLK